MRNRELKKKSRTGKPTKEKDKKKKGGRYQENPGKLRELKKKKKEK